MYKHRLFQWRSEDQKANRNNFYKNWDDSHFCVTFDLYSAYRRPFVQMNGIVQKITEKQVLYYILIPKNYILIGAAFTGLLSSRDLLSKIYK